MFRKNKNTSTDEFKSLELKIKRLENEIFELKYPNGKLIYNFSMFPFHTIDIVLSNTMYSICVVKKQAVIKTCLNRNILYVRSETSEAKTTNSYLLDSGNVIDIENIKIPKDKKFKEIKWNTIL